MIKICSPISDLATSSACESLIHAEVTNGKWSVWGPTSDWSAWAAAGEFCWLAEIWHDA